MIISNEVNPPLDEVLEHHGVLGMKWGKHRAKASATQIHAARSRVATQANRVRQAEAKAARVADPKERAAATKKAGAMKVAHLNNPDRVVAVRLTRGEKAVAIILGTTVSAVGGFGAVAATSAASRRIEQKQRTGAYNK